MARLTNAVWPMFHHQSLAGNNIHTSVQHTFEVTKFGLQSEQTTTLYAQQIQWLAMQTPAINNPFSVYFRRTMHIHQAADAWPAPQFWRMVKNTELSGLMPAEEVGACQLDLLSGKLLTITQEDDQAMNTFRHKYVSNEVSK